MFQMSTSSVLCIVAALIVAISVEGKRYRAHDAASIVANTIGPFNNPTEVSHRDTFAPSILSATRACSKH
jgi:hypothetical protein